MSLLRLTNVPRSVSGSNHHVLNRVRNQCLVPSLVRSSVSTASGEDDFFGKNKRLNRPLSPYTNYKLQLTSIMSITHRISGVALSVAVYGLGLSQLLASSNFQQQLTTLSSVIPSPMLSLGKVLVVTGFGYHLFNGIRHLIWDMGFGFKLKELYLSGYIVIALTALVFLYALVEYR
ncbi:succinate dehydrogenase cytochrome b560 subunit, mitochondrial-like [Brevipalpus obovatus]|uniref:succinate dehydrogenase cytochrome b560 subunit, mitochondrial-like n=1 Tax=Brevipalpus obovatus TaxID=246614 RepID=UPI003D9E2478